ncbi:unnamed protein product [Urochloa humidicola]
MPSLPTMPSPRHADRWALLRPPHAPSPLPSAAHGPTLRAPPPTNPDRQRRTQPHRRPCLPPPRGRGWPLLLRAAQIDVGGGEAAPQASSICRGRAQSRELEAGRHERELRQPRLIRSISGLPFSPMAPARGSSTATGKRRQRGEARGGGGEDQTSRGELRWCRRQRRTRAPPTPPAHATTTGTPLDLSPPPEERKNPSRRRGRARAPPHVLLRNLGRSASRPSSSALELSAARELRGRPSSIRARRRRRRKGSHAAELLAALGRRR